jgi:hypothetical protein
MVGALEIRVKQDNATIEKASLRSIPETATYLNDLRRQMEAQGWVRQKSR